jgi:N6-adenosine-specific RNA methylase IME4
VTRDPARPPAFQPGTYGVIYADPPWQIETWSARGKGRAAEAYYDTMGLDAIKALPVGIWASRDAVLLLWPHNSMLPQALEVMTAWGFAYKARGFTWAKTYPEKEDRLFVQPPRFVVGLGKWTRLSTEVCLLGTRGKPRRLNADVRELVISARRAHSQKPDELYELIERLAEGPYLELFATRQTPHRSGWQRWFGKDPAPERRWASGSYPNAVSEDE